MSYSAEQVRGTKDVTYHVADTDVIVKSVTMSGEMFENVVRANTLALIDEHKGEIEFSNGFFGNFAEFDKSIYDETGVDAYEGSKISNMNEIRKLLVQITEERYNDILSELIAQEQFGDDNIDYERQETMSYYNKEGKTDSHVKMSLTPKSDSTDNSKQNESEMRYYLTNRDVRLNYFGSDNGHRMPSSVTLPKHTVVAVDEANKETDYVGYDSLRAWMNDEPDFVNLCDVKAMSYEISKEQYDTLYDLETRSYDSVHDYHMRQNEYYENESNENKDVCFERLCEADTARHSVAKEHANTLETVLDGLGKTNVRLTDTFAGKIEKYGVDIDFTKINSLDVEIASDVYVGGMDENGHEAKDNFRQEKNVISFFMGPENNDLYVYDEHHGFDDPIPTRRALEKISDYLDEAARDSNVSLYVKQNDGKTKPIAPILADTRTSKPFSRKMAMLTGLAKESEASIEMTNDYSFG